MLLSRRGFIGSALAAGAVTAFQPSSLWAAAAVTRPYRAFKDSSFWNTPLPAGAPIDPQSDRFIADAKANSGDYLMLTLGNFALPTYFGKPTDPLHTVVDTHGRKVTLHIPDAATPMESSDSEFRVFDRSSNVCVGFHHTSRDSAGQITAEGLDRWHLDSNGLHGALSQSDDDFNVGHRGSPAPLRAIRLGEVQRSLIAHKLAVYWWATAPASCFPMSGFESGRGGIVPEGTLLRVKRSIDLTQRFAPNSAPYVIAKAFQDYGLYISDNSGSGSRVKLEKTAAWAGLNVNPHSLAPLKWDDYEFILQGYGA